MCWVYLRSVRLVYLVCWVYLRSVRLGYLVCWVYLRSVRLVYLVCWVYLRSVRHCSDHDNRLLLNNAGKYLRQEDMYSLLVVYYTATVINIHSGSTTTSRKYDAIIKG